MGSREQLELCPPVGGMSEERGAAPPGGGVMRERRSCGCGARFIRSPPQRFVGAVGELPDKGRRHQRNGPSSHRSPLPRVGHHQVVRFWPFLPFVLPSQAPELPASGGQGHPVLAGSAIVVSARTPRPSPSDTNVTVAIVGLPIGRARNPSSSLSDTNTAGGWASWRGCRPRPRRWALLVLPAAADKKQRGTAPQVLSWERTPNRGLRGSVTEPLPKFCFWPSPPGN